MKRWALVVNNTCSNVVEQEDQPTIQGEWVDVSSIFMGPGWQWDGIQWNPPSEIPT